MVSYQLSKFPDAVVRPAIVNQDAFSQLRGANVQNENPTYILTQSTQNAVIFGQSIISRKSNIGIEKNTNLAELQEEMNKTAVFLYHCTLLLV